MVNTTTVVAELHIATSPCSYALSPICFICPDMSIKRDRETMSDTMKGQTDFCEEQVVPDLSGHRSKYLIERDDLKINRMLDERTMTCPQK